MARAAPWSRTWWLTWSALLIANPSAVAEPAAAVDGYRATVRPQDGFIVNGADVGTHGSYAAQLHLEYANDPLVFEDAASVSQSERASLVEHQLAGHAVFSVGLSELLLLYAALPVNLWMTGESQGELPAATGFGPGDLRLGARIGTWNPEPLRFAIQLEMTAPTGEPGEDGRPGVAGDSGATVQPEVIGELRAGQVALLVNLGARWRKDESFAGVRFTDTLVLGGGLAWSASRALRVLLEAKADSPLDELGARSSSRLEAQLGFKLEPWSEQGWTFGAAGGAGLVRGYGSPDFRVVLMMSYRHEPKAGGAAPGKPPAVVVEDTPAPAAAPPAPPPETAAQPAISPPPPGASPHAKPVAVVAPAATTSDVWLAALAAAPRADSDRDRSKNARDRCPLAPGPKSRKGCPKGHDIDLAAGVIVLKKPLRFHEGAERLKPEASSYLGELAATLRANAGMTVQLEAYVAASDPNANLTLTRRRALAVRDQLARRGVAPDRIRAYGCGESRPIAPNNVPWGRKKNERVELHLLDPAPSSGVHSTEGCVLGD
jgi:outer membrane protein OmpA-like peptidoglycan-associated protein